MENAFHLAIPLETDAVWGVNWGDMQDMNA
jgi:DNA polymerase I-like protein with 3'-5' exonuclease and polymerase domains